MKALKYYFIEFLNRGIRAQIGLFGALTLFFILIFALIVIIVSPQSNSILDSFWDVTTWMLDPGNYADSTGFENRLISFVSTLVGILLMSSLIGLISASLMDFILQVRKGVGNIEEKNYTLIVGWNFRVYKLITEIIRANLNVKAHTIVILSDKDKIEMDDEIKFNIDCPKKIKIITRSVDLLMLNSYKIIDLNSAKSIILLSNSEAKQDISVMKLMLMMDKIVEDKTIPIVFEIENKQQHRLLKPLFKKNYYPVLKENLFTQALVQITLQTGLTDVFNEIFSFEGNELYIYPIPNELLNTKYSEVYMSLNNASLVGIYDKNGTTKLCPKQDPILTEEDKIIVLMKDDDELVVKPSSTVVKSNQIIRRQDLFYIEHILILGWNQKVPFIVDEVHEYVEGKVNVTIISEEVDQLLVEGMKNRGHLVDLVQEKYFDFDVLEKLDFEKFDRIMIVSSDGYQAEESDTLAISTFIFIKNILQKVNKKPLITLQIEVQKNRDLIESDVFSEFLISDSLISGIISQLAENVNVNDALTELTSSNGNEIYFIPAEKILTSLSKESLSIQEMYSVGISMGFNVIGIKVNTGLDFTISLNPDKDSSDILYMKDEIVVIGDFD